MENIPGIQNDAKGMGRDNIRLLEIINRAQLLLKQKKMTRRVNVIGLVFTGERLETIIFFICLIWKLSL